MRLFVLVDYRNNVTSFRTFENDDIPIENIGIEHIVGPLFIPRAADEIYFIQDDAIKIVKSRDFETGIIDMETLRNVADNDMALPEFLAKKVEKKVDTGRKA